MMKRNDCIIEKKMKESGSFYISGNFTTKEKY